MKKKVFQITVLSLFLIMGCSKDDLIKTEQELISVEKNKQPVIYGEKGPTKDNAGVGTGIWFKGTSSVDSPSLPIYFYSEDDEMQILSHGSFSGRLIGYGKIDEIRSYYDITILSVIDNETVDYTMCLGRYTYNIEIGGTVYVTDRNSSSFTFSLTGEFNTYRDFSISDSDYWGMSWEEGLTGKITEGKYKFLSWEDKTLIGSIWCDNLETGIISLNIQ